MHIPPRASLVRLADELISARDEGHFQRRILAPVEVIHAVQTQLTARKIPPDRWPVFEVPSPPQSHRAAAEARLAKHG